MYLIVFISDVKNASYEVNPLAVIFQKYLKKYIF